MGERRGGGANGGEKRLLQIPTFVQAKQGTGAKGVSCPGGARDIFARKIQRRLPKIFAFAGAAEAVSIAMASSPPSTRVEFPAALEATFTAFLQLHLGIAAEVLRAAVGVSKGASAISPRRQRDTIVQLRARFHARTFSLEEDVS